MLYRRGYLYTYQVGVSCIHVRERYPFTFVVIFSVMNRMQCRAGTKTSPGPSSNGSSRTKTDPFKARKIGSSKTKKKKKSFEHRVRSLKPGEGGRSKLGMMVESHIIGNVFWITWNSIRIRADPKPIKLVRSLTAGPVVLAGPPKRATEHHML